MASCTPTASSIIRSCVAGPQELHEDFVELEGILLDEQGMHGFDTAKSRDLGLGDHIGLVSIHFQLTIDVLVGLLQG